MATHSCILIWRIQWTEEPGMLQSMGSWRIGDDWRDLAHAHIHIYTLYLITDSNSLLVIVLFQHSTSSWVSFGSLCFPLVPDSLPELPHLIISLSTGSWSGRKIRDQQWEENQMPGNKVTSASTQKLFCTRGEGRNHSVSLVPWDSTIQTHGTVSPNWRMKEENWNSERIVKGFI